MEDVKTWPTPSASLVQDGEDPETWRARMDRLEEKHRNGNGAGTPLTMAARTWPTPTTKDGEQAGSREPGVGGPTLHEESQRWPTPRVTTNGGIPSPGVEGRGSRLEDAAGTWPTPTGSDGNRRTDASQTREGAPSLTEEGARWPSPRAEDGESAGNHPGATDSLTGATKTWPTPAAADGDRATEYITRKDGSNPTLLGASRRSPPVLRTSTCGPECSPKHRRLNPLFVEWLMNFPLGWTDSELSATAWSLWWRQSRSWLSRIVGG